MEDSFQSTGLIKDVDSLKSNELYSRTHEFTTKSVEDLSNELDVCNLNGTVHGSHESKTDSRMDDNIELTNQIFEQLKSGIPTLEDLRIALAIAFQQVKEGDPMYEECMFVSELLNEEPIARDPTNEILLTLQDDERFEDLIPELRQALGFRVNSDDECLSLLQEVKEKLQARNHEFEAIDLLINLNRAPEGTVINFDHIVKAQCEIGKLLFTDDISRYQDALDYVFDHLECDKAFTKNEEDC